jgi:malonyl CoA-acyl carrier protein transacylase
VITGEKSAVETAGSSLKEAGAKRVILLNVSGPFHSPMMETAGQQLARVLENVRLNQPVIPYVSNVTADFVGETGEIKDLLIRQGIISCEMAAKCGKTDRRRGRYICGDRTGKDIVWIYTAD